MPPIHRLLKTARSIHLYLGVFTVPALLFFAVSGGLQTFSLHETTRGSSYAPPAWLASVAQLHKKQTTVVPLKRPRPAGVADRDAGPRGATAAVPPVALARPALEASVALASTRAAGPVAASKNLLPMKLFFALVSLGLCLSTLTGLYMAYRYSRTPRRVSVTLCAGVLVPLLLWLL
jgi:hypothetical protein